MNVRFKLVLPLLLLLALPAVMQAQFDYVITNGTATITKYMGFGGAVPIPGMINGYPVTTIGPGAFANANLSSITITNTITAIGDGAFYDCVGLTELIIPSSVRSIGASAFAGCFGLTGVTIPFSVTNLGDVAFYGCGNMIGIVVNGR